MKKVKIVVVWGQAATVVKSISKIEGVREIDIAPNFDKYGDIAINFSINEVGDISRLIYSLLHMERIREMHISLIDTTK